ncbi:Glucosylceramidase [Phytophthora ramorum]|uniref:Glucosylceramidase n=1 Tax=Phytophthora ramorum TaxID=164328 RepID=UPI0030B76498|nr:Glucosylceramidase [Phytophthora ramorum]
MSQPKSAPEPEACVATHLSMKDGHFVDQHGRVALLRGVNLGGSSKLPVGYGHTDDQDMSAFFDGAASVSFVGRPFPLEEADLHLSRLQRWGLTFLRFIVTWEAIEHAGPGQLDHEYLTYIRAVVEKAAEYNMQVYIDPHQDVWSRWTGGDGAPMWTLECIGLEPRNFEATKAALCLETCGLPASKFPKMIWPTNYGKLACATMFTLFWAGKKYAPNCYVDGVQIQEYLQSHYLDALAALAEALKGLPNVAGYGTMNEPSNGWIGTKDLLSSGGFRNGYAPSPFSAMLLGEGIAQDVEVWGAGIMEMIRGKPARVERVDPKGVRAWKDGASCIWREAGVWGFDAQGKPQLLKPSYFDGINFGTECFLPFARKFTKRIQCISPKAMIFTEMPPTEASDLEFPQISSEDIPLSVNAMHWYDLITLFTTTWRSYFTLDFVTGKPAFGNAALRQLHQQQLAHTASFGREKMANAPTLIGETGIPYNMNHAQAFETGDFSAQMEALDNTIYNLESQLLSFTLWNYTADNSHKFGDLWNLEDLSISSPDSEALAHRLSGVRRRDDSARALRAFARPHGRRIAGIPSKSQFDLKTAEYVLEYTSEKSESSATTEIYVPYAHYPEGYRVTASDGHFTIDKHEGYDVVKHAHDGHAHKHRVLVLPTKPLRSGHSNWPVYLALAAAVASPYIEAYTRK